MRRAVIVAAALSIAASGSPACAQATGPITFLPSLAGDYFALDSEALERRMHVFVRLPENYGTDPAQTYPVVYLLDGDSLFPMLAPQHLLLHYDEGLSEAIVVGIAYGGFDPSINMRHVDFRRVREDSSPGGATAFLDFLQHELLPRVEARWRADSARRVLFGQTRAGSFVLYAAYERPESFHAYIASNPAPEADTRLLHGMSRAQPTGDGGGWLIVTSGSRDRAELRELALRWRRDVAGKEALPWRAEFIDIGDGTHAASAPLAYRASMLRVFGGHSSEGAP